MNLKQQILLAICLFLTLTIQAQELMVKSMKALPRDTSACTYSRMDLTGKPCALVKVQPAATGAQFEGNVIGKVDYKTNEYWVYMSEGSYMLSVKHPSFVPLSVNFRDYGISGVQGKTTYQLTVLMPQESVSQTQKLTINYSPANAMVLVDSKPYQGNGSVELTLPVGSHEYQLIAMGYVTVEGIVKLNSEGPRVISENLVASQVVTEPEMLTASQMNDLGDDYYDGRNGKTKDYTEALKWYRKSAELEDAFVQANLGNMYRHGYGVPQDYNEALKWISKSVKRGNALGQLLLGLMYLDGSGVPQDYYEAFKLFRRSADQGNLRGQVNVGYMYNEGYGVQKDYLEAVKWYKKAAEQGDAYGQRNLGLMYEQGNGVGKDIEEAIKWYWKAAEQGEKDSQFHLGRYYQNGTGVSQDLTQAKYWYEKAAAQGHEGAKKKLEELK